jgi:hypothetical protein
MVTLCEALQWVTSAAYAGDLANATPQTAGIR